MPHSVSVGRARQIPIFITVGGVLLWGTSHILASANDVPDAPAALDIISDAAYWTGAGAVAVGGLLALAMVVALLFERNRQHGSEEDLNR